jgi:hypothetical protein
MSLDSPSEDADESELLASSFGWKSLSELSVSVSNNKLLCLSLLLVALLVDFFEEEDLEEEDELFLGWLDCWLCFLEARCLVDEVDDDREVEDAAEGFDLVLELDDDEEEAACFEVEVEFGPEEDDATPFELALDFDPSLVFRRFADDLLWIVDL